MNTTKSIMNIMMRIAGDVGGIDNDATKQRRKEIRITRRGISARERREKGGDKFN